MSGLGFTDLGPGDTQKPKTPEQIVAETLGMGFTEEEQGPAYVPVPEPAPAPVYDPWTDEFSGTGENTTYWEPAPPPPPSGVDYLALDDATAYQGNPDGDMPTYVSDAEMFGLPEMGMTPTGIDYFQLETSAPGAYLPDTVLGSGDVGVPTLDDLLGGLKQTESLLGSYQVRMNDILGASTGDWIDPESELGRALAIGDYARFDALLAEYNQLTTDYQPLLGGYDQQLGHIRSVTDVRGEGLFDLSSQMLGGVRTPFQTNVGATFTGIGEGFGALPQPTRFQSAALQAQWELDQQERMLDAELRQMEVINTLYEGASPEDQALMREHWLQLENPGLHPNALEARLLGRTFVPLDNQPGYIHESEISGNPGLTRVGNYYRTELPDLDGQRGWQTALNVVGRTLGVTGRVLDTNPFTARAKFTLGIFSERAASVIPDLTIADVGSFGWAYGGSQVWNAFIASSESGARLAYTGFVSTVDLGRAAREWSQNALRIQQQRPGSQQFVQTSGQFQQEVETLLDADTLKRRYFEEYNALPIGYRLAMEATFDPWGPLLVGPALPLLPIKAAKLAGTAYKAEQIAKTYQGWVKAGAISQEMLDAFYKTNPDNSDYAKIKRLARTFVADRVGAGTINLRPRSALAERVATIRNPESPGFIQGFLGAVRGEGPEETYALAHLLGLRASIQIVTAGKQTGWDALNYNTIAYKTLSEARQFAVQVMGWDEAKAARVFPMEQRDIDKVAQDLGVLVQDVRQSDTVIQEIDRQLSALDAQITIAKLPIGGTKAPTGVGPLPLPAAYANLPKRTGKGLPKLTDQQKRWLNTLNLNIRRGQDALVRAQTQQILDDGTLRVLVRQMEKLSEVAIRAHVNGAADLESVVPVVNDAMTAMQGLHDEYLLFLETLKAGVAKPPSTTGLGELGDAGSAIADNMYQAMYTQYQAGKTTEAGAPSRYLIAAQQAGPNLSFDEFKALVQGMVNPTSSRPGRPSRTIPYQQPNQSTDIVRRMTGERDLSDGHSLDLTMHPRFFEDPYDDVIDLVGELGPDNQYIQSNRLERRRGRPGLTYDRFELLLSSNEELMRMNEAFESRFADLQRQLREAVKRFEAGVSREPVVPEVKEAYGADLTPALIDQVERLSADYGTNLWVGIKELGGGQITQSATLDFLGRFTASETKGATEAQLRYLRQVYDALPGHPSDALTPKGRWHDNVLAYLGKESHGGVQATASEVNRLIEALQTGVAVPDREPLMLTSVEDFIARHGDRLAKSDRGELIRSRTEAYEFFTSRGYQKGDPAQPMTANQVQWLYNLGQQHQRDYLAVVAQGEVGYWRAHEIGWNAPITLAQRSMLEAFFRDGRITKAEFDKADKMTARQFQDWTDLGERRYRGDGSWYWSNDKSPRARKGTAAQRRVNALFTGNWDQSEAELREQLAITLFSLIPGFTFTDDFTLVPLSPGQVKYYSLGDGQVTDEAIDMSVFKKWAKGKVDSKAIQSSFAGTPLRQLVEIAEPWDPAQPSVVAKYQLAMQGFVENMLKETTSLSDLAEMTSWLSKAYEQTAGWRIDARAADINPFQGKDITEAMQALAGAYHTWLSVAGTRGDEFQRLYRHFKTEFVETRGVITEAELPFSEVPTTKVAARSLTRGKSMKEIRSSLEARGIEIADTPDPLVSDINALLMRNALEPDEIVPIEWLEDILTGAPPEKAATDTVTEGLPSFGYGADGKLGYRYLTSATVGSYVTGTNTLISQATSDKLRIWYLTEGGTWEVARTPAHVEWALAHDGVLLLPATSKSPRATVVVGDEIRRYAELYPGQDAPVQAPAPTPGRAPVRSIGQTPPPAAPVDPLADVHAQARRHVEAVMAQTQPSPDPLQNPAPVVASAQTGSLRAAHLEELRLIADATGWDDATRAAAVAKTDLLAAKLVADGNIKSVDEYYRLSVRYSPTPSRANRTGAYVRTMLGNDDVSLVQDPTIVSAITDNPNYLTDPRPIVMLFASNPSGRKGGMTAKKTFISYLHEQMHHFLDFLTEAQAKALYQALNPGADMDGWKLSWLYDNVADEAVATKFEDYLALIGDKKAMAATYTPDEIKGLDGFRQIVAQFWKAIKPYVELKKIPPALRGWYDQVFGDFQVTPDGSLTGPAIPVAENMSPGVPRILALRYQALKRNEIELLNRGEKPSGPRMRALKENLRSTRKELEGHGVSFAPDGSIASNRAEGDSIQPAFDAMQRLVNTYEHSEGWFGKEIYPQLIDTISAMAHVRQDGLAGNDWFEDILRQADSIWKLLQRHPVPTAEWDSHEEAIQSALRSLVTETRRLSDQNLAQRIARDVVPGMTDTQRTALDGIINPTAPGGQMNIGLDETVPYQSNGSIASNRFDAPGMGQWEPEDDQPSFASELGAAFNSPFNLQEIGDIGSLPEELRFTGEAGRQGSPQAASPGWSEPYRATGEGITSNRKPTAVEILADAQARKEREPHQLWGFGFSAWRSGEMSRVAADYDREIQRLYAYDDFIPSLRQQIQISGMVGMKNAGWLDWAKDKAFDWSALTKASQVHKFVGLSGTLLRGLVDEAHALHPGREYDWIIERLTEMTEQKDFSYLINSLPGAVESKELQESLRLLSRHMTDADAGFLKATERYFPHLSPTAIASELLPDRSGRWTGKDLAQFNALIMGKGRRSEWSDEQWIAARQLRDRFRDDWMRAMPQFREQGSWKKTTTALEIDQALGTYDAYRPHDAERFVENIATELGVAEAKRIGYDPDAIPFMAKLMMAVKGQMAPFWLALNPIYHINNIAGNVAAYMLGQLRTDVHAPAWRAANIPFANRGGRAKYLRVKNQIGGGASDHYTQPIGGMVQRDGRRLREGRITSLFDLEAQRNSPYAENRGVQRRLREEMGSKSTKGLTQNPWWERSWAHAPVAKHLVGIANSPSTVMEQVSREIIFGSAWEHRYNLDWGKAVFRLDVDDAVKTDLREAAGFNEVREVLDRHGVTGVARDEAIAQQRKVLANARFEGYSAAKTMLRDYQARNRLDGLMDQVFPIHFWATKNAMFVGQTFLQRPALIPLAFKAHQEYVDRREHLPAYLREGYIGPIDLSGVLGDKAPAPFHFRMTNYTNPAWAVLPKLLDRSKWDISRDAGAMELLGNLARAPQNVYEAMGYRVGPHLDGAGRLAQLLTGKTLGENHAVTQQISRLSDWIANPNGYRSELVPYQWALTANADRIPKVGTELQAGLFWLDSITTDGGFTRKEWAYKVEGVMADLGDSNNWSAEYRIAILNQMKGGEPVIPAWIPEGEQAQWLKDLEEDARVVRDEVYRRDAFATIHGRFGTAGLGVRYDTVRRVNEATAEFRRIMRESEDGAGREAAKARFNEHWFQEKYAVADWMPLFEAWLSVGGAFGGPFANPQESLARVKAGDLSDPLFLLWSQWAQGEAARLKTASDARLDPEVMALNRAGQALEAWLSRRASVGFDQAYGKLLGEPDENGEHRGGEYTNLLTVFAATDNWNEIRDSLLGVNRRYEYLQDQRLDEHIDQLLLEERAQERTTKSEVFDAWRPHFDARERIEEAHLSCTINAGTNNAAAYACNATRSRQIGEWRQETDRLVGEGVLPNIGDTLKWYPSYPYRSGLEYRVRPTSGTTYDQPQSARQAAAREFEKRAFMALDPKAQDETLAVAGAQDQRGHLIDELLERNGLAVYVNGEWNQSFVVDVDYDDDGVPDYQRFDWDAYNAAVTDAWRDRTAPDGTVTHGIGSQYAALLAETKQEVRARGGSWYLHTVPEFASLTEDDLRHHIRDKNERLNSWMDEGRQKVDQWYDDRIANGDWDTPLAESERLALTQQYGPLVWGDRDLTGTADDGLPNVVHTQYKEGVDLVRTIFYSLTPADRAAFQEQYPDLFVEVQNDPTSKNPGGKHMEFDAGLLTTARMTEILHTHGYEWGTFAQDPEASPEWQLSRQQNPSGRQDEILRVNEATLVEAHIDQSSSVPLSDEEQERLKQWSDYTGNPLEAAAKAMLETHGAGTRRNGETYQSWGLVEEHLANLLATHDPGSVEYQRVAALYEYVQGRRALSAEIGWDDINAKQAAWFAGLDPSVQETLLREAPSVFDDMAANAGLPIGGTDESASDSPEPGGPTGGGGSAPGGNSSNPRSSAPRQSTPRTGSVRSGSSYVPRSGGGGGGGTSDPTASGTGHRAMPALLALDPALTDGADSAERLVYAQAVADWFDRYIFPLVQLAPAGQWRRWMELLTMAGVAMVRTKLGKTPTLETWRLLAEELDTIDTSRLGEVLGAAPTDEVVAEVPVGVADAPREYGFV